MPDAKKEAKALLHEREDTIDNYKEENEGLKNKIIELQNMKSVFLSDEHWVKNHNHKITVS